LRAVVAGWGGRIVVFDRGFWAIVLGRNIRVVVLGAVHIAALWSFGGLFGS